MSLSDAVFAASWTVLEDRFNRHFNEATVKVYRRTLAAELDDEQFKRGCAASFRFDTFFPSPQQLIEYGLGGRDASSRALKLWGEMMERVSDNESATSNPIHRRLLMRATNGQPLGLIPHERLTWVEKSFVRLYSDHLMDAAQSSAPELAALTLRELPNASD